MSIRKNIHSFFSEILKSIVTMLVFISKSLKQAFDFFKGILFKIFATAQKIFTWCFKKNKETQSFQQPGQPLAAEEVKAKKTEVSSGKTLQNLSALLQRLDEIYKVLERTENKIILSDLKKARAADNYILLQQEASPQSWYLVPCSVLCDPNDKNNQILHELLSANILNRLINIKYSDEDDLKFTHPLLANFQIKQPGDPAKSREGTITHRYIHIDVLHTIESKLDEYFIDETLITLPCYFGKHLQVFKDRLQKEIFQTILRDSPTEELRTALTACIKTDTPLSLRNFYKFPENTSQSLLNEIGLLKITPQHFKPDSYTVDKIKEPDYSPSDVIASLSDEDLSTFADLFLKGPSEDYLFIPYKDKNEASIKYLLTSKSELSEIHNFGDAPRTKLLRFIKGQIQDKKSLDWISFHSFMQKYHQSFFDHYKNKRTDPIFQCLISLDKDAKKSLRSKLCLTTPSDSEDQALLIFSIGEDGKASLEVKEATEPLNLDVKEVKASLTAAAHSPDSSLVFSLRGLVCHERVREIKRQDLS